MVLNEEVAMPEQPVPDAPFVEATSYADRRASDRIQPELVFRCRVLSAEGVVLKAAVLDISLGGAGLLLSARLERDTTVTLLFTRGRSRSPLAVLARVVYCTEQDRGASVLGCAFVQELTAAELRSVLP
jgi:hypothetical protein